MLPHTAMPSLTSRILRRGLSDEVLEDHLQIGTDLAQRLAFHVRKVVAW